ncbi:MAG: poly-gamma-glutamate biosynthesis protein PgsC [Candidatus Aminicenantes bacterium]|nr:poly-gamma-glutamate biosynthesis protein PgsC [Candidatus Aminicenantes bacterium]
MTFETILIGLLCAVLFIELFGFYPGGIIVPAYIALYLNQPFRILATLIISFLCLLIFRLLSRFFILFGKRRFVMFIFLGALMAQFWAVFSPHFFAGPLELRAIGWLIPGLLANNLEKQKIVPTLASLITVAVTTYFIVRLLTWVGI